MGEQRFSVESRQVVPALPGFYVLDAVTGSDGKVESFAREPIVAWVVIVRSKGEWDTSAFSMPVTIDACDDAGPILYPDGTVHAVGDQVWVSEEQALEHFRKEPDHAD